MALRDRYLVRVGPEEPYIDGSVKIEVWSVYILWDTVANAVVANTERILRHQHIVLTYDQINAIDTNPLNNTNAKKRQALYDLISSIVTNEWKTDKTDLAFKAIATWIPSPWPSSPVEIILRDA